jgi:diaminohydroxyphosphoribosylaminopyrimidine deaminase/5-amino-6-(5-phosphoribosylamino)uracil reductase
MVSSQKSEQEALDRSFMAAAIRFSRKHAGLTSTNPSVGTLIVRNGVIVGRGVTAIGGRPHAEPQALAEAGDLARGATAYVTLEPCAHHGRTPPCANALVTAGITRVVGAASDPDSRVSGKGYAILREAGIEVVERVMANEAADQLAPYLARSIRKRPEVILKLAVSKDGMIGRMGSGQVPITGPVSRRQVHMTRAEVDAIIVGIRTAIADDPELTVRLPGLEARSPARIVLDRGLRLPLDAKMVATANAVPVFVTACPDADAEKRNALEAAGVKFLAAEVYDGRIALPELLEDLASQGMSSVLVEGGAATAKEFLEDSLVDRVMLFEGKLEIGAEGIASPIRRDHMPAGFTLLREAQFGDDLYSEWLRAE